MATTRVYILAKALGVKSAAIVAKCKAEDVDVKNHMSVISAGLAATISEWFSEGANITTVETADKVDLEVVRIKKKKRAKKKKTVEKTKTARTKAEQRTQAGPAPKQQEIETAEEPAEAAVAVVEPPALTEPPETTIPQEQPIVVEPEPVEPEPVLPAGPMLEKPEPAKLSGPQIVRVEAPEPLRPPPRAKARYDQPATEPLMYSEPDERLPVETGDSEGKQPAGKHKERTHGRRRDEQGADIQRRPRASKWRQRDIEERRARLDAAGGEGLRARPSRRIAARARLDVIAPARPQKAVVAEPVSVKNLSAALAVKASAIITKLIDQGVMATANQNINNETAQLIALEFGTELTVERKSSLEDQISDEFQQRIKENRKKRAVVATMLGHVDHGKTSLLDKIRSTDVTAGEAGGITQHIGAYQVAHNKSTVTFLDTPGHEAFTAMRARGANMTDVAVLVVAADDGVMPQTIEAIAHSKAANVAIIVALNKIDLPGCDVNRIYSQLAEQGLAPTEWGGDTEVVKTSAVTGQGIEDLLEHLDYIADLLELKADDTIPAIGWVIEAKMSTTQGPVATLLIEEGRLRQGDAVLAGTAYGKVKTLTDSHGKNIKTAVSATPVEITGLSGVPQAGDRFYCLTDINRAKAAAEQNQIRSRESSLAERAQVTLDNLFTQIEAGNVKELNIIIRADVQGSVDVLNKYLEEISTDEVRINILYAATGGITEGDVVLAEASNAIIVGFNVVADERAGRIADAKKIDVRLYNVIYRITEDLKKSMVGLLEPKEQEQSLGRAVVRRIFKISRLGTVAGCYVNSGIVSKNAKARLIRDNVVIRDGLTIDSLKHLKDDVRQVKAGLECGIKLARFDDIKTDDVLDCYEIVKVDRTL
jgi:translation initiation factor IF-2